MRHEITPWQWKEWNQIYSATLWKFRKSIKNGEFFVKLDANSKLSKTDDSGKKRVLNPYIPLVFKKKNGKIVTVNITKYIYGDRDLEMLKIFKQFSEKTYHIFVSKYKNHHRAKEQAQLIKRFIKMGIGVYEYSLSTGTFINHNRANKRKPRKGIREYLYDIENWDSCYCGEIEDGNITKFIDTYSDDDFDLTYENNDTLKSIEEVLELG